MSLRKVAAGITGFDEASGGGFPAGRTSLVEGGTGCGKTVFTLQSLLHGPRARGEIRAFVAFEESPQQICLNARSFGRNEKAIDPARLIFVDARPDLDQLLERADDDRSRVREIAWLQRWIRQQDLTALIFNAAGGRQVFIGDLSDSDRLPSLQTVVAETDDAA